MTEDKPVQIRTYVEVYSIIGADQEDVFDGPLQSEWDSMTEDDKEEYLRMCAETVLSNEVGCSAEVIVPD